MTESIGMVIRRYSAVSTVAAGMLLLLCGLGSATADEKPDVFTEYYGFAPMEIIKLDWQMGLPNVADVNGDGLNDLIVSNDRKARIELLLQRPDFQAGDDVPIDLDAEDINDIFGKERKWRFRRVSYPLDVKIAGLVLADLNADGWLDMAFSAKDALRIVLQRVPVAAAETGESTSSESGPREPQWQSERRVDIVGAASGQGTLCGGDLNGDRRADLACLAGEGVFLLRQEPDGTMGRPIEYASAAENLRQLAIADVNGDGLNDLVIRSGDREYPVRIRMQATGGRLGPELRLETPLPSVMDVTRFDPCDAALLVTVSGRSGRVLVSGMTQQQQGDGFAVYTYPLPATRSADDRDIVAADVDGDGLLDVVVSDPDRAEFSLFMARSNGLLRDAGRFPGLKDMRKLAKATLEDGSAAESIIALSVKEKLIGVSTFRNGRLTFPDVVEITGEPLAMDVGDIDKDGLADLVYVAKVPKKQQYYMRSVLSITSQGGKIGPTIELTLLKNTPRDMRIADINGDGRVDVMVISSDPLLLVAQNEEGQFAEVDPADKETGLVSKVFPNSLSFAPLGVDGTTAALLTEKGFARSLVFDSDRGWRVIDQYHVDNPQSRLAAAAAYRLEAAGPLEIAAYDSGRSKLAVLKPQQDGTYRLSSECDMPKLTVKKIVPGDFGGSVPISLLLCGTNKLVLVGPALQRNELVKLGEFEPDITETRFHALATGDVNDDGEKEILLCDRMKHYLQIVRFDQAERLVAASRFKVFEEPRGRSNSSEGMQLDAGEPRGVTIGDVTADGRDDIILLVHDRLIIYPQN